MVEETYYACPSYADTRDTTHGPVYNSTLLHKSFTWQGTNQFAGIIHVIEWNQIFSHLLALLSPEIGTVNRAFLHTQATVDTYMYDIKNSRELIYHLLINNKYLYVCSKQANLIVVLN